MEPKIEVFQPWAKEPCPRDFPVGRLLPAAWAWVSLRRRFPWERSPFQRRLSWSSRAQASTRSNIPGELLEIRVITLCRQARLT